MTKSNTIQTKKHNKKKLSDLSKKEAAELIGKD